MPSHDEYSKLDRPEILRFIFFPRQDNRRGPSNSTDYSIPVDNGISIGCRFYVHSQSSPSILPPTFTHPSTRPSASLCLLSLKVPI